VRSVEPFEIPREEVSCALCGGIETMLLFEVKGRELPGVYLDGVFHTLAGRERIVKCCTCGLVYVNPRLTSVPGLKTYSMEQELAYFEATREDRRAGNESLLRQLESAIDCPGRVLDVGCGDGLLLTQARSRGWESWGLEVSEELVARIRVEHGFAQIFHGTLEAAAYPSAHFDAVVLINVIEHLRDPVKTVSEAVRVMRPGGILAVHTPNLGSLAARRFGPDWHHYEPLEHFYYFDVNTLTRLLQQNELRVVGRFSLHSASKFKHWLLTVSHWLGLQLDNGLGLLARSAV
jgi:2-polyprenyl-3-methyl-5-hydroxy-6-metoxy-1,4-benzoquinol methylase